MRRVRITIFNPMSMSLPLIERRMEIPYTMDGDTVKFTIPDYLMPFADDIKIEYTQ